MSQQNGQDKVVNQNLIKGQVKLFKKEEGYGFVAGQDGKEYYFNSRALGYGNIPTVGDYVAFEVKAGAEADAENKDSCPEIKTLRIVEAAEKGHDDRIECPHCKKKIIPRVVINHGEPDHSVCPYCGVTVKVFESNVKPFWVAFGFCLFFLGFAITFLYSIALGFLLCFGSVIGLIIYKSMADKAARNKYLAKE